MKFSLVFPVGMEYIASATRGKEKKRKQQVINLVVLHEQKPCTRSTATSKSMIMVVFSLAQRAHVSPSVLETDQLELKPNNNQGTGQTSKWSSAIASSGG